MTTLTDWFRSEARECLDRMAATVEAHPSDPARLRPIARALRGHAQLARAEAAQRAAAALEAACRAAEEGSVAWDDGAAERARATIDDLRVVVEGPDDRAGEAADAVVERWSETSAASQPTGTQEAAAHEAFIDFTRRELKEVLQALDAAIEAFVENPEDHGAVQHALASQAALLGSSRLDTLSVIGESLRALEEMSKLILRLGAPVKREWLEVYRAARDVLGPAATALEQGEEPQHSPALSRLRTMREELRDRHKPRDAAAPEADGEAPLVDIRDLCFDGPGALRRATELQPILERAVARDPAAREALEELFDLIRLALE